MSFGLLGKRPVRHDKRTLQMAAYGSLPSPPSALNWAQAHALHKSEPTTGMWPGIASWPMDANDRVGDCAFAAASHMIQEWSTDAGSTPVVLTDAQVLSAYSAVTGYDPADPSTDQGSVLLDVLNYWRKTGIAGHKILGYAQLEPGNTAHVKDSVFLFGNCYIGVALPLSAQNQSSTWSVVSGPDSAEGTWGGHCVPIVGYNTHYLYFVSWGKLMKMTWQFWHKYVDEAYAVLAPEWLSKQGADPLGVDLATLQADIKAL